MPSAASQGRSNRSWTQRVASIIPFTNNPQQNVTDPQNVPYSNENQDDNVQPSPQLLQNLKSKEWTNGLADILEKLVNARRSYLNHTDENWQSFLDRLQDAFLFFEKKAPCRDYREEFTIENYRMLFQRESSAYRDDVCRGVKRIRDGMWVNGEEVKFDGSLVQEGLDLASRGENVMDLVYVIDHHDVHNTLRTCVEENGTPSVAAKARNQALEKFISAMFSFDEKYVVFEKNYIEALIAVEKQSRSLVQQVAELITELDQSGEKVNQKLLDKMAELNKKSRDCFNCKYDNSVMQMAIARTYEQTVHQKLWYLSRELIEKFDEICKYLQDLLPKILRVHPKLEHNPGLVQRLEKFHEMYQRVMRWIMAENPMSDFCHFLDQHLLGENLGASVEKVLLIPRAFLIFVWTRRHEIAADNQCALAKLVHEFQPEMMVQLSQVLITAHLEEASIDQLIDQIITNGIDTAEPTTVSKAFEVVSMQLQRTNATAWNAYVSVILHEDEDAAEKMARPRLPSV